MRFKASATSAPIDLAAFRSAVPILAARWRALQIGEHGVEKDGVVNRGLRVESGAHPWPGVRYRLRPKVLKGDTRGPRVWFLDLTRDDSGSIEMHLSDDDATNAADVMVVRPATAEAAEIDWVARIAGVGPLMNGLVTTEVKVDLRRPRVDVTIGHRLVRGHGIVHVDVSNPGRWRTSFEGTLQGRGLLRPIMAVAAPFVRTVVNRQLKKAVAAFPGQVDEFNRQASERFGTPPSPERIADSILDDFLNNLVDAD